MHDDEFVELAQDLNELYSQVTRRLFQVSAHNHLETLKEIHSLIGETAGAWPSLPEMLPPPIGNITLTEAVDFSTALFLKSLVHHRCARLFYLYFII